MGIRLSSSTLQHVITTSSKSQQLCYTHSSMFCYCATQILRYTYDGCTGVSGKLIVDILHNSQRHHLAKYKFSMISLTEPFLFCGWSNYLEWTPNRSKAPPKRCLFSIPPPSQDCSFPLGMGRERL